MPRTPQWTYDWWENALEYMFWINAAAFFQAEDGIRDGAKGMGRIERW